MKPGSTHRPNSPRRANAPGAGATRKRARKGEGEKLRDEILDEAEQLLIEQGSPDNVSMRAIAERVGVTPPSLYIHFADKDDLFLQCCSRRFMELQVSVLSVLQEGSVLDRLWAIGEAYINFGLRRGQQYEAMWSIHLPAHLDDNQVAALPGYELLLIVSSLVSEGIADGEIRPDLDPQQAAIAMWGFVHGTTLLLIDKDRHPTPFPIDVDAVIQQTLVIIRRGIWLDPV
jgi:AcrR family transcriptional regulator